MWWFKENIDFSDIYWKNKDLEKMKLTPYQEEALAIIKKETLNKARENSSILAAAMYINKNQENINTVKILLEEQLPT